MYLNALKINSKENLIHITSAKILFSIVRVDKSIVYGVNQDKFQRGQNYIRPHAQRIGSCC